MSQIVNAVGLSCPQPVIQAKKAIEEMKEQGILEVLVDNEVAVANLGRLAAQKNLKVTSEKFEEGNFSVKIQVELEKANIVEEYKNCAEKNLVLVISSNEMGTGDPELGKLLMKGFVYAVSQLEILPSSVLLYNSGAYLSAEGSDSLEDLRGMEEAGVEILTCGTCLNHYKLADKLAVGAVTNMYTIGEKMAGATNVIRP